MNKKTFMDKYEEREELNFFEYMDSHEGYVDFKVALNHVVHFQKKITIDELSKEVGYTSKTIRKIMNGWGQQFNSKRDAICTACGYELLNFHKLGNRIKKGIYDPLSDNIPTLDDDPIMKSRLSKMNLLEQFINRPIAVAILEGLLELEKLNQMAFAKVVGMIDDEIHVQKNRVTTETD